MKKLISILGLLILVLSFVGTSRAQLAPPNNAGVSMGHLHFLVPDPDASLRFWATLGGTPIKISAEVQGTKFPGVLILVRKGDPTGPMEGSVINHVGFRVPNVQAAMAKWKSDGLKTEAGNRPQQGFVYTPEGIKIEFLEDATLSVPIAFQLINFRVPPDSNGTDAIPEMRAWYTKMFGAKPGRSGKFDVLNIPGVSFSFTKSDVPVVGSKGRALDFIGIEVKNLEAFCKTAEANGVKFDSPFTRRADLGLSVAFLTDPWGTYIELNEGLDHY